MREPRMVKGQRLTWWDKGHTYTGIVLSVWLRGPHEQVMVIDNRGQEHTFWQAAESS